MTTFKIGDQVRITRKSSPKDGNWGDSWICDMDKEIGTTQTIDWISSCGRKIGFKDVGWNWPAFVLEKVGGTPPTPPEIKESKDIIMNKYNTKFRIKAENKAETIAAIFLIKEMVGDISHDGILKLSLKNYSYNTHVGIHDVSGTIDSWTGPGNNKVFTIDQYEDLKKFYLNAFEEITVPDVCEYTTIIKEDYLKVSCQKISFYEKAAAAGRFDLQKPTKPEPDQIREEDCPF